MKCRGDEETLEDCEEGEKHDCALGEVAAVVCYFGDETQHTTTTVATSTKAARAPTEQGFIGKVISQVGNLFNRRYSHPFLVQGGNH